MNKSVKNLQLKTTKDFNLSRIRTYDHYTKSQQVSMTTMNKTKGLRISAVVHEYSEKGLVIQVHTVVQV